LNIDGVVLAESQSEGDLGLVAFLRPGETGLQGKDWHLRSEVVFT
jgi:hypothetical protein